MKKESKYMLKIQRDDDKDWGFGEIYEDGNFITNNIFLSDSFENSKNQLINLISYIKETLRIKEYIREPFDKILLDVMENIDSTTKEYIKYYTYDYDNNFVILNDKEEEFYIDINNGCSYLNICIAKVNIIN